MTKKVKIRKEITDKYGKKVVLDDALCEKMTADMFQAVRDGNTTITVDNRAKKGKALQQ
ncbi:MAG: hypothetical protein LBR44_06885 [Clostridiales Family XIII bacterium]|jgi:hypothetical protein|nr:hypothetical protein [Clostridiales Family XIII bacterium]